MSKIFLIGVVGGIAVYVSGLHLGDWQVMGADGMYDLCEPHRQTSKVDKIPRNFP